MNDLIIPLDDPDIDSKYHVAPPGVSQDLWSKWISDEEVKKDQFLWQLKRGSAGQNVGLSNGLEAINRYIYGTHKARYYLIGAESSAGKTTVGDFMYVLKAWEDARRQNRPIKIYYCSFEIGRTDKLYRWASYYIFIKHGVQLPSDYLQGRINGRLPSPEHQRMVLEAYTIITEMMKDVIVIQDTVHPTKIFEDLIEAHFSKHGKVHRADVSAEDKKKGRKGYVTGYDEYDPSLITILFIDHLALTGTELHLETKGIMDKMSKYMIVIRNLFHGTGVFIQQFSTDMMATYRGLVGKKTEAMIAPQRIDFGDSKATYRDADVVYGLVKPQADMKKFLYYDLSKDEGLGDCFTALYLMKNRYGPSNRLIPLFVDGISGHVYELPMMKSENPFTLEKWYTKANEIETLCQMFSPSQPSL